MKKKDLLRFIDRVETKAIRSVSKKWEDKIQNKKDELMSNYKDELKEIEEMIGELSKKVISIESKLEKDEEICYEKSKYSGLSRELEHHKGEGFKASLENRSKYKGEVYRLKKEKQKEIDEVSKNYRAVYDNCKDMKSGKAINIYLNELGFDTSDYINKIDTKKVEEIDKTKLFVCGDNR